MNVRVVKNVEVERTRVGDDLILERTGVVEEKTKENHQLNPKA